MQKRTVPIDSFVIPGLLLCLALMACSLGKKSAGPAANQQAETPRQAESSPTSGTTKTTAEAGALNVGEASGSYTAKGETVQLKYAYAGRGERFGEDSVIVLVTDKPIPADALAEELKSQTMLLNEKLRGLEYVFMKDSYWVRFHPSQYQESKGGETKNYSVENDIVRFTDDDNGSLTDGRYSRSVKFVAAISK
jgi:hypothetical protein